MSKQISKLMKILGGLFTLCAPILSIVCLTSCNNNDCEKMDTNEHHIKYIKDRSFSFITKTPPAAVLIKKAVGLEKASGEPNKNKVGTITKKQIEEIAALKMPDLNAASLESAMSMISGTARSMGVLVAD